jgi:branched-chain amino acid transport system substrate-binding protein
MKKAVIIFAALLIVSILVTAGCVSPAPAPGPTPGPAPAKTLPIGALLSTTGWWSTAYDISIWRMTEVAVDMINEEGGLTVNGDKYNLELIVEDCKSTFDGVASAANRLVYDKDVKFIVGPTGFFMSPASPITNPAKVMMVIGWHLCAPGECDATTPYNFATSHGSITKSTGAIKAMRRDFPQAKNIVLASPDDGAIPFLVPKELDVMADNGFTLVGDVIPFPNEMEDFSPIVAQMLSHQGVDAVFVDRCPPPGLGAIAKGLRDGGFNGPIFTGSPIDTNVVAAIGGATAAEGVRTMIETLGDPEMPPVMAEMARRVTAKYGADFPLSYQCATGVYLIKTLIEAAQSVDPTDVKAKFESMDKVNTIYGTGLIGGEETFGIKHVVGGPVPVQKFENGKAVPAGWVDLGLIP